MPPVRQSSTANSSSTRPSRQRPTRLENVRTGLQGLFLGTSSIGRRIHGAPESPKTPQLALGHQNFSSTRLNIPYLLRTSSTHSTNQNQTSTTPEFPIRSPATPISTRPITRNSLRQEIHEQSPTTEPQPTRQNSRSRFAGIRPSEQMLDDLIGPTRSRRRHKSRRSTRRCVPKVRNRRIRGKILSCCISGAFLTLVLAIYLALALSNRNESEEFHVLLILIILITTIIFCHGLIRLCMMIIHPPNDGDLEAQNLPAMSGPGGYANPPVPIRVALARDEEAAGVDSQATKVPPPAYGLWRESVRMDPNRIYWQRNEAASTLPPTEERPATANRPPSYISEDGIDYVVEAAPRSIAPTTDVPLASQSPINGAPRLGQHS